MNEYLTEYNKFLETYKQGAVDAEAIGELIVHLAQYYATYNLQFAAADYKFNVTVGNYENQQDPNTLKPLTSTKARSFAESHPDYEARGLAKAHVENIDCLIQSLKSLQKGILKEWHQANA